MRNCTACIWRARDCSSRFCPLLRCPYDDRAPLWKTLARRMRERRQQMPAPAWVRRREV